MKILLNRVMKWIIRKVNTKVNWSNLAIFGDYSNRGETTSNDSGLYSYRTSIYLFYCILNVCFTFCLAHCVFRAFLKAFGVLRIQVCRICFCFLLTSKGYFWMNSRIQKKTATCSEHWLPPSTAARSSVISVSFCLYLCHRDLILEWLKIWVRSQ